MNYKIISADSHITEPPDTYSKRIDPKFRDRSPHIMHQEGVGDFFVIPGMKQPIPMGLVAAAGKPKKVAIVACMRKQLLILNTMMKNGTYWDANMT